MPRKTRVLKQSMKKRKVKRNLTLGIDKLSCPPSQVFSLCSLQLLDLWVGSTVLLGESLSNLLWVQVTQRSW